MTPLFLFRLVLDLLAISLLLTAFAYDWFGNAVHEIIGTSMFALLISHNIFNRRWYGKLTKGWGDPRSIFSRTVTLALLLLMPGLLISSVIVSQTVFSFLPVRSSFTVRQVHALIAYLVLFIAALHLGLQWSMIMRVARQRLGITRDTRVQGLALRGLAVLIAAYGIHSLFVVDVRSKLLMEVAFSFWDFEAASVGFILRHIAIVGLGAIIAHYSLKLLDLYKQRRSPSSERHGQ
ncbi:DUF4405 domain-containing protein (plasmid) [Rhizobium lusitanum]|uniref:DUF4405 domain-containing protein n=1 Tax=Rhizobium lusitanum TaxID=293958 RepID=UPI00161FD9D2|nr:DUF4405 domain-containing protein [Rhizobium lusitanum]QND46073.1 DUF4405 domain-containing protein [Rhizobium lusitanum]